VHQGHLRQVPPREISQPFPPSMVMKLSIHVGLLSCFPWCIDAPFIGTAPLLLCLLLPPTGRRALHTLSHRAGRPYPADSFSTGCTHQPVLKVTHASLSHRQGVVRYILYLIEQGVLIPPTALVPVAPTNRY
jgi:hypothetical protein